MFLLLPELIARDLLELWNVSRQDTNRGLEYAYMIQLGRLYF